MGIGIVLLVWGVLFMCAGAPVSIGLAVWSWRTQRRVKPQAGLGRPIAAALLPCVLFAYGGIAFIGYAVWCEGVRHVDAGIGDSWMVPVGNDHFFCMIDVPEHGYLLKGGCSGSPPISNIVELAEVGSRIIGRSASDGPFVFDTSSSELRLFPDLPEARRTFPSPIVLESANKFYTHRRWGWNDLLALVILGSLAAVIMALWYRLFVRAPALP